MPNWNSIHTEIENPHDQVRRKYLKELNTLTGRNVIIYYSGFLTAASQGVYSIGDHDKIGLMGACNDINCSDGLDLILHTPGGDIAATESIVDYLKTKFTDIRVVVPQIAMSAGTMIACSANRILMGKQSSLGPIDPQIGGIPAHAVLEEFKDAKIEIAKNPSSIPIWQVIIGQYPPAFFGQCRKAIKWSETMVREWLEDRMFDGDKNAHEKIKKIIDQLGSHSASLNHARHYSAKQCLDLGLKVEMMEDDQKLQDAVLSVHHATMHSLSSDASGPVCKLIENHDGNALVTR